jgi:hypothetical protein
MPEVVDEHFDFFTSWLNYLFVQDPIYRGNNVCNKDFIRKKLVTDLQRERQDLDNVITRAYRPLSFVNTVQDNWMRIFAFGALERLVVLRQSYA